MFFEVCMLLIFVGILIAIYFQSKAVETTLNSISALRYEIKNLEFRIKFLELSVKEIEKNVEMDNLMSDSSALLKEIAKGKVVWIRQKGSKKFLGVQLINLDEETQKKIFHYILNEIVKDNLEQ